jgi:hypothetical protein
MTAVAVADGTFGATALVTPQPAHR